MHERKQRSDAIIYKYCERIMSEEDRENTMYYISATGTLEISYLCLFLPLTAWLYSQYRRDKVKFADNMRRIWYIQGI